MVLIHIPHCSPETCYFTLPIRTCDDAYTGNGGQEMQSVVS